MSISNITSHRYQVYIFIMKYSKPFWIYFSVICTLILCIYIFYYSSEFTTNQLLHCSSENEFNSEPILHLPLCPYPPPNLNDNVTVNKIISLNEAEDLLALTVDVGGEYRPKTCKSRWRIAIIISFRNRDEHLGPFHYNIHKFLQKQQLEYTVFIVNQTDNNPFNRAKLFNVGFLEVTNLSKFDCFIFHDIDFLPLNEYNLYHCVPMPRLVTVYYKHPYNNDKIFNRIYFGGVVMFTEEHIRLLNGWSNRFWGWGGEDDDMKKRVLAHDLPIWKFPKSLGTYEMLHHKQAPKNPDRYKLLKESVRLAKEDGLNSLNYTLIGIEKRPLFTVIHVALFQ